MHGDHFDINENEEEVQVPVINQGHNLRDVFNAVINNVFTRQVLIS